MKQIKYFCNLCTENKEKQELFALYWDGTLMITFKEEKQFGGYKLITDLEKCDKHICKSCLRLASEFNQLT